MNCSIYKSARKRDTFLFVRNEKELSDIPDALLTLLGELEQVMILELHPKQKLARAEAGEVMRQIEQNGYYLQLPPAQYRPC